LIPLLGTPPLLLHRLLVAGDPTHQSKNRYRIGGNETNHYLLGFDSRFHVSTTLAASLLLFSILTYYYLFSIIIMRTYAVNQYTDEQV